MRFMLLAFMLIISQLHGQGNALFQDVENDPDFPAFNKELTLVVQGDTIAAYAFIANGATPKETIILAHGFPGFDTNFDIAHILRRNNFNVIHFNYRGAWGNQGKYMYSNCLVDLASVIESLSVPEMTKKLRIQSNAFIILGRSYGGGIALIGGSQNEKVKKIIAISSTNYGTVMEQYENLSELKAYKSYMQKQVMIKTNIDEFLEEMLLNKTAFNVVRYREELSEKKVLLIENSDRNDRWINELIGVKLVKMESDHGFIDKRVEMTEVILNWLKG